MGFNPLVEEAWPDRAATLGLVKRAGSAAFDDSARSSVEAVNGSETRRGVKQKEDPRFRRSRINDGGELSGEAQLQRRRRRGRGGRRGRLPQKEDAAAGPVHDDARDSGDEALAAMQGLEVAGLLDSDEAAAEGGELEAADNGDGRGLTNGGQRRQRWRMQESTRCWTWPEAEEASRAAVVDSGRSWTATKQRNGNTARRRKLLLLLLQERKRGQGGRERKG